MLKWMSIVGARPNFMKVASISRAIEMHNAAGKKPAINHLIVHTGQHYDDRLSKVFFKDLGLPEPHINLGVGSASHAMQTAEIMKRFEPVLLKQKPDAMILVGDVNSTVACALVASKIQYPLPQKGEASKPQHSRRVRPLIVHVEAGLRSFDRTMPEEINRILTDSLSDLLFVTEKDAIRNLRREGVELQKIHFVGNVMIDTLMEHMKTAERLELKGLKFATANGYGVVTLHRPSNVDDPQKLASLMDCLRIISSRIPLIFPVHPRTRTQLSHLPAGKKLRRNDGLCLTAPLGYLEFLKLLRSARLVLTDSGGIQEETTFMKVPCITLRENTERPITVATGTNYLVGGERKRIVTTALKILDGKGKKGRIPPFWDGRAGRRIVNILVRSC